MAITLFLKDIIKKILNKINLEKLSLNLDNLIYDLQRYKRIRKSTILKINIEFSNYCNLRCIWCNINHNNKKIDMKEGLFEKFLKNLIEDKRLRRIDELHLWNAGEPLIHPKFLNLLRLIKKYKQIAKIKKINFPRISLLTNGMLLNEVVAKEIIDLDLIYQIGFSIDGGSKEKYEEIRKGAKWEIVNRNIRNFIRINNGKIRTRIICIVEYGKEKKIDWMLMEFRELLEVVDEYELRYPHDWDGSKEFDISKNARKYYRNDCRFCKFLSTTLVLLPSGDISVCCIDTYLKGVVGNIAEQDLFSIYKNKIRKEMIRKLRHGKKDQIDLCKNCICRRYSPFINWIQYLIKIIK